MLELAILKVWTPATYRAAVQLVGSLTTYLDNIPVAVSIPLSAMVVGNFVLLAIPGGNIRDACVVAAWPGGSPVRPFASGWTAGRGLIGAGLNADPAERFVLAANERWINENFLIDIENPASRWSTERAAGAAFVTKVIGRVDLSTGAVLDNHIRLFSDLVPGGAASGNIVFTALTQWGGTTTANSSVYLGAWDWGTTRRPSLTARHFGWNIINGAIWATVANGTTQTTVDTGVTYDTAWRARELTIFRPGWGPFEFYIGGVLRATITTNLPNFSASLVYLDIVTLDAIDKRFMITTFNWRLS